MTDEQKTTKNDDQKPEDKNSQGSGQIKTDESAPSAQDSPVDELSAEEKATLDKVIQEAEQEKPSPFAEATGDTLKKGKSQYTAIKPEDIRPGMLVRVHQKIIETNAKGEEKERVQVFQGMVLAHKHGNEAGATILVRKVSEGIGVEKIFPLAMPSIEKIELVRTYRVRQARPYFLRATKKRLTEIKE